MIEADPDLLAQAMINLLRNAAQATREAGRGQTIALAVSGDNGVARRLTVADAGGGIPEASAPRHLPALLHDARARHRGRAQSGAPDRHRAWLDDRRRGGAQAAARSFGCIWADHAPRRSRVVSRRCATLAALARGAFSCAKFPALRGGARGRDRTADTAIFSRMLYQLSYPGIAGVAAKERAS